MTRTEKHDYLTPAVKAVAFRIERGFEASPIESADSEDENSFQELTQSEDPNADIDRSYF